MSKSAGFALLGSLILMPICILIFAMVLLLKTWLLPAQKSMHICQNSLLKIQNETAQTLQSLVDLNAEVVDLRIQRSAAELALEAALAIGFPPPIAAAESQLELVQMEQVALAARQETLKQAGLLHMEQGLIKLRQDLKEEWLKFQRQKFSLLKFQAQLVELSVGHLAVHPVRSPDPGPPTYELDDHFFEVQALHASWRVNQRGHEIKELQWSPKNLHGQQSCSASLRDDGPKLRATLLLDKSFWN